MVHGLLLLSALSIVLMEVIGRVEVGAVVGREVEPFSTAQPSPSGRSSFFRPGKKGAIWPTVFSCL
jgi:hypothetical protein